MVCKVGIIFALFHVLNLIGWYLAKVNTLQGEKAPFATMNP
jgi:hypothetical protein